MRRGGAVRTRVRGAALYATAVLAAVSAPAAAAQEPLRIPEPLPGGEPLIVYLANEGMLVRAAGEAVLFDALFREGVRGYPTIRDDWAGRVEAAQAPFDVQLVVASHHHADHFDAAATIAYLEANRSAHFVSTPPAETGIRELDPNRGILARVHAAYPEEGARVRGEWNGIELEVLNLHHGRRGDPIPNLGHLATVGGVEVLHMGDTEVTPEEIRAQRIADDRLDVALVPYWLLLGDEGVAVREAIGARQIVAMHLPVADVPANWWGDLGSRKGTILDLERRHPGILILDAPGLYPLAP